MGVLRAKVVAIATLATVVVLSACAPAAEGGPTPTESESAEASPSASASPSVSVTESESPEPTPTPDAKPAVDDDDDDSNSSPAKNWTYVWAPTEGYPTYFPEALPATNDDGTVGSGCHPPDSDTLPDGVWRVLVYDKSYDEEPNWIDFDLACSYSFEFPDTPEIENPEQYSRGDWGYLITNENSKRRVVTIADDAIGHGPTWDWAPGAWDDTWVGCGIPCDTWIWINDGEITELAWPYDWSTEYRAYRDSTG